MATVDVFRPSTIADKQRWRQRLLGLDPDSPTSFSDVSHARKLAWDMHSGRRPDLAPSEDYNPPWPLGSEGDADTATGPAIGDSENGEQSEAIPASTLFSKLSLGQSQGQSSPTEKPSQVNRSISPLLALEKSLLSTGTEPSSTEAPATSLESFATSLLQAREKREAEQTTKEGRAKWDKTESGLPGAAPPGTYKRAKERLLAQRTAQKLDWHALQEAVSEYKEKAKEGTSAGTAAGTAKTGGGKGKKGRK